MPAQVLSFFARPARSVDWSREELAELYRVEHALVQAGLSLDTDRGLSDEGDPWFVFCRADGDVLVHISRIDGLYSLSSPGLPRGLVGRSFPELTRSFIQQVPVAIPMQRGNGARLFVHPAAMLAVIVGTLFIAFDDVHFLAVKDRSDPAHGALEAQAQLDSSGFRANLQHAFQHYMETFLGGTRDDGSSKFSFYLNIISTVTAFIFGSMLTALESPAKLELLAAAAPDSLAHESSSQQQSVDDTDHLQGAVHSRPLEVTANLDVVSAPVAADPQEVQPIGHQWRGETNASSFLSPADSNGSPSALNTPAVPQAVDADAGGVRNLHDSNMAIQMTTHGGHDAGGTSIGAATVGSGPAPGVLVSLLQEDGLSSVTINQLLQHTVNAFVELPSDAQSAISQIMSEPNPENQNAVSATSAAVVVQYHFHFDADGQAALQAFLQANPNAEAVVHNKNVIIYDGAVDPGLSHHKLAIELWQLDSAGATIALVGHVDHPTASA